MDREEVLRLAKLARVDIQNEEAEALAREFGAILEYVGEIKGAEASDSVDVKPVWRNVWREDTNPHESSAYTKDLLAEVPNTERDFVKVKKIL